jgi:FAD/FMN-containing dehydrogenase
VGLAREYRRGAEDRGTEHQARCLGTDFAHSGVRRARRPRADQAFPEIRIVAFGHLGDGNLHYNQSQAAAGENAAFIAAQPAVNRIVYDLVHELGGSISAEHGIGQLKRDELLRYKSPVEIEMMRAIKRVLDPQG